jgi:hypothetical protein
MYVGMHVCRYACIRYAYMDKYMCAYLCKYVCVYECLFLCRYAYMCLCMYAFLYVCMFTKLCMDKCVCVSFFKKVVQTGDRTWDLFNVSHLFSLTLPLSHSGSLLCAFVLLCDAVHS